MIDVATTNATPPVGFTLGLESVKMWLLFQALWWEADVFENLEMALSLTFA